MDNVLEEFLVRIGADIDAGSFNAAMQSVSKLEGLLTKAAGVAQMMVVGKALLAAGQAAKSIVTDVAAADMEFTKLARSMWVTKDTAKTLHTAMKVMGASQQDIAWIPELREQFFRLRDVMNELATPADADGQLRWIREIGYDIEELQVKFKALKEWVAYYLIKYLEPYIKEFQEFIQWLSDKLGKNLPEIARKVAQVLAQIASVGASVVKFFKGVFTSIYDFVDSLPDNVKKWTAIFAAVGAAIMASPFGLMIAAIGGALVLIQDFMYYMNGWNSSKALAPMWKKLLEIVNSKRMQSFMQDVKTGLSEIAVVLDGIVKYIEKAVGLINEGINWDEVVEAWSTGLSDLKDGVSDLYSELRRMFGYLDDETDAANQRKHADFWHAVGAAIEGVINQVAELIGGFGDLAKAIALAMRGEWIKAGQMLARAATRWNPLSPAMKTIGRSMASGTFDNASQGDTGAVIAKAALAKGLSKEGAAALVGSASAESRLDPTAVEIGDADDGTGYRGAGYSSKEEYMRAVMDGKQDFINDGVGFGLAQWTSPERKAALWDYAVKTGRPIYDRQMQTEFLLHEIQEKYPRVWEALKSGNISLASRMLTQEYEVPEGYLDPALLAYREGLSSDAYSHMDEWTGSAEASKGISGGYTYDSDPNAYEDTYAAGYAGRSFAAPAYAMGSGSGTVVNLRDINVNVRTDASADEIGTAVRDALAVRSERGAFA